MKNICNYSGEKVNLTSVKTDKLDMERDTHFTNIGRENIEFKTAILNDETEKSQ